VALKRLVLATGRSLRQEVTMQAGGARTRYDLHVEPQRDLSGAIIGVTGAAIEIVGERGKAGAATNLRQAISDRDALLDRIGAPGDAGVADRGLFTICIEVLCRKLGGYAPLSREDAALLGLLERKRRFVPARQMIQIDAARSWLVGNGWVYSYKSLSNGERQVLGFHLPGDLIGGDAGGGGSAASFAAVTDCVLCEFDRGMVMKLRRAETVLPDALKWADAREDAILQQQLISIGRRSAIARVAHLLLELGARLKLVGLADDRGYDCPLSQELIADALGLTKIHVNRMLRELRERGCLTLRNGKLSFGDMASLMRIAEYDPDYLDLRVAQAPSMRSGFLG
jgi:CRP-like cAMP-binding protein